MIYTYEAQHADIKSSIQPKVDAGDWAGIVVDATDLALLETLIKKTPFPTTSPVAPTLTVMVNPLPTV